MEDLERDKMLASAYQLKDRELVPFSWYDPFSDMGTDEKSKLFVEFMNQLQKLNERLEQMESERATSLAYKTKFEEEHNLTMSLQARMDQLLLTIESLRDQLDLINQHKYGSKSQKRKICKSKIIKVLRGYSCEQISSIVEHEYELIRYKTLEGTIIDGYFLCDGVPEIIDAVPGTHASSSFLAYLAFNKYVLDTPLYREFVRLMDEQMQVSRITLTNWLEKGSKYVNELIKILKDHCLEKDSIVNCDETWCRVTAADSYKKKYIWCLVNKAAKVVIYCYEDGSRGRDALRHILGVSQLKALQSDGYNVYMYLDDELIDTEHLCCLAHARAKFKLDAMLSDAYAPRGDLMEKALKYLYAFWNQLFAYTKDGSYTIDNSIAERFIPSLVW